MSKQIISNQTDDRKFCNALNANGFPCKVVARTDKYCEHHGNLYRQGKPVRVIAPDIVNESVEQQQENSSQEKHLINRREAMRILERSERSIQRLVSEKKLAVCYRKTKLGKDQAWYRQVDIERLKSILDRCEEPVVLSDDDRLIKYDDSYVFIATDDFVSQIETATSKIATKRQGRDDQSLLISRFFDLFNSLENASFNFGVTLTKKNDQFIFKHSSNKANTKTFDKVEDVLIVLDGALNITERRKTLLEQLDELDREMLDLVEDSNEINQPVNQSTENSEPRSDIDSCLPLYLQPEMQQLLDQSTRQAMDSLTTLRTQWDNASTEVERQSIINQTTLPVRNLDQSKFETNCTQCKQVIYVSQHRYLNNKTGQFFCHRKCQNVFQKSPEYLQNKDIQHSKVILQVGSGPLYTPEVIKELREYKGINCAVHGCNNAQKELSQYHCCVRHDKNVRQALVARAKYRSQIVDKFIA